MAAGEDLARVQLSISIAASRLAQGKKSLAFNLTYIAPDRTLTDKEVLKLREKIIYLLDEKLDAKLRSKLQIGPRNIHFKECQSDVTFSQERLRYFW